MEAIEFINNCDGLHLSVSNDMFAPDGAMSWFLCLYP
jgi:hypothetical protein